MAFAVVALGTTGLQVVEVVAAAVHYWDDVVYVVGGFATVVAVWFVLQDDGPVAFVFGVAVFFRHCYRALSRLLSFVCLQVARWARAFCVGLLSVCYVSS